MTNQRLPIWAHDIPLLSPEVRQMSERAVNLVWAEQLQRQAAEREQWRQVLAPRQAIDPVQQATAIHGPYRRHRMRRALRGAAVWCAFIAGGLLAGTGISALSGCSLASDADVERLVALDLVDAQQQAQILEKGEIK